MKKKSSPKKSMKKSSYRTGQEKSMYYKGTPVRGMDMPIKVTIDRSKSNLGK